MVTKIQENLIVQTFFKKNSLLLIWLLPQDFN